MEIFNIFWGVPGVSDFFLFFFFFFFLGGGGGVQAYVSRTNESTPLPWVITSNTQKGLPAIS